MEERARCQADSRDKIGSLMDFMLSLYQEVAEQQVHMQTYPDGVNYVGGYARIANLVSSVLLK